MGTSRVATSQAGASTPPPLVKPLMLLPAIRFVIHFSNWEYNFTDLPGEAQFRIQAKQSSQMWSISPDGWNYEPNVLGLDDVKTSTVSVAPAPPKITSPQNNTYDRDSSISVSGSAERGSTVELFEGTTSKGTTKADSSTRAWSIALSKVSDGAHTYSAKATNAV